MRARDRADAPRQLKKGRRKPDTAPVRRADTAPVRRAEQRQKAVSESRPQHGGDDAWWGYPGAAEAPREGEPLRVVVHTFAAWGEGQEALLCYMAEGMERAAPGAVEWFYLVAPPSGDEVPEAEVGARLREWGEVRVLPREKHLRRYAVLQAVLDWRPHVGHANGPNGVEHLARCGLPVLYARDGVAGVSAPSASSLAALSTNASPLAGEDGRNITNGITAPSWPERRCVDTAVYVGRLDTDKAPELLLDAVARVPGLRLEVVGRANRRAFDVNAEAAARGIADRVTWHGQLPMEEARRIATSADIVLCANTEGFGLGLAEAIAGGAVPVVVDEPGYQATLARAVGGYVCARTIEGLADGIMAALAEARPEEERYTQARRFGRTYAAERMAAEYLAAYREILTPSVDIIVLAHQEARVTRDCLLAVLANTWGPYRLVLVDNGSPGDEVSTLFEQIAVLSGHPALLLRPAKNLGCPGGRRYALGRCDAPFAVTLDNDMLVPPGWLGKLLTTARENPDAGAVGAWWSAYGRPPEHGKAHDRRFGCAAALLRRAALPEDAYAGDLAGQQVGNDSDLLWRMLEDGWRLMMHPGVYWFHVGGPPGMLGMTRRHAMDQAAEARARAAFHERWAAPGVRRMKE